MFQFWRQILFGDAVNVFSSNFRTSYISYSVLHGQNTYPTYVLPTSKCEDVCRKMLTIVRLNLLYYKTENYREHRPEGTMTLVGSRFQLSVAKRRKQ